MTTRAEKRRRQGNRPRVAYEVTHVADGTAVVWATSPGAARYERYLAYSDISDHVQFSHFKVRRAPGYDAVRDRHRRDGTAREYVEEHLRDVAAVEAWNAAHPVGTPVLVHSVLPPVGPARETRTRSEAYVTDAGHAAIFLEGIAGCYALTHVVPRCVGNMAGRG